MVSWARICYSIPNEEIHWNRISFSLSLSSPSLSTTGIWHMRTVQCLALLAPIKNVLRIIKLLWNVCAPGVFTSDAANDWITRSAVTGLNLNLLHRRNEPHKKCSSECAPNGEWKMPRQINAVEFTIPKSNRNEIKNCSSKVAQRTCISQINYATRHMTFILTSIFLLFFPRRRVTLAQEQNI